MQEELLEIIPSAGSQTPQLVQDLLMDAEIFDDVVSAWCDFGLQVVDIGEMSILSRMPSIHRRTSKTLPSDNRRK